MVKVDSLLEVLGVQVGVNFCCRDALMPEHILHSLKVGTAFYEVRGE